MKYISITATTHLKNKNKKKIPSSIESHPTKIKSCLEYINFVFVFLWIFKGFYTRSSFFPYTIHSHSLFLSIMCFFPFCFRSARVLCTFANSIKKCIENENVFRPSILFLHCLLRRKKHHRRRCEIKLHTNSLNFCKTRLLLLLLLFLSVAVLFCYL